jgi:hypothetical protein
MVVTAPVKVRLRIPLKLPYKNELTPSYDKGAFFRYQGLKREWKAAIPEALPHQRALGARRLTIVRIMGPRERPFDTGNVYYACAAIIDIVAQKGYLVDDTPDLLELEKPVQRLAVGDELAPATYIEIEDLPGAAVKTARLPGV